MSGAYQIGGEVFRTKREIVQHVRGILARTEIGAELAADDLVFMRALLARHPFADQKLGAGVQSMLVELNAHWTPRKGFVLVRVDGSRTDFSFYSCIYPTPRGAEFREACRHAVTADVLAFKRHCFDTTANEFNEVDCAITGDCVGWTDAHVDHAPPWTFQAIVTAFVEQQHVDMAAVPLVGDGDNECQRAFADPAMKERFRKFHNARAQLRVVTRAANLSRRP